MPRRSSNDILICPYFQWVLRRRRGGVWYADGRRNRPRLGRFSLGTADRTAAREALTQLDLKMACRHGLADPTANAAADRVPLTLVEGRDRYLNFVSRPEVAGGVSAATRKRYHAILDKFLNFALTRGIQTWTRVTDACVADYLQHLKDQGYADRTLYIEGNTLKQVCKWLVQTRLLPREHQLHVPLRKPSGSPTVCYTQEQVDAMIAHCRERPDLHWLADVIAVLARTGLRIQELANLRWADIGLAERFLCVTNDPAGSAAERRRTKNRTDRRVPLFPEVQAVLAAREHADDGYVFHGPHGGRLKPDTVRNVLIREVLTPLQDHFPAQPGAPDFAAGRLHSFRHHFCSFAANRRVPEPVLRQWLGHADSRMVRLYYHLHDAESLHYMEQACSGENGPSQPSPDRKRGDVAANRPSRIKEQSDGRHR